MKRAFILSVCVTVLALGVALGAYQSLAPAPLPPLSRYAPSGALLYLEAKDFASLLSTWNSSREKQQWLKSANYEVFSRSRLFFRLGGASDRFAAAAGLPPDMNFLSQVAGTESALALYDIGNLELLYITKLTSAGAAQSTLWQSRAKFSTREAGGVTFYLRRDAESEKEVLFAVKDDYLLLATREDLMAGALQLMAGGKNPTIETEPWFSRAVSNGGPSGDLRMVLNLEALVPSPYFRSYWVQQNITDMKQYASAVCDLFLSKSEFREERVLIKKTPPAAEPSEDGAAAVADLARLVPPDAGVFQLHASPTPEAALTLLETKLLAPHLGPGVASQVAPQVTLTSGETGNAADLETRIDVAPAARQGSSDSTQLLRNLLQANPPRASLQLQSSALAGDSVFVRLHSAVGFVAATDWNEAGVRTALVGFVRPSLTASQLGLNWASRAGYAQLDGLWPLAVSVRGKYLVVSDDPDLMAAVLGRWNAKPDAKPAILAAGFNHSRERERFSRFTGQLDARREGAATAEDAGAPAFFSRNIASLSSTLAGVSSQRIAVRDAREKVLQTVIYEWTP